LKLKLPFSESTYRKLLNDKKVNNFMSQRVKLNTNYSSISKKFWTNKAVIILILIIGFIQSCILGRWCKLQLPITLQIQFALPFSLMLQLLFTMHSLYFCAYHFHHLFPSLFQPFLERLTVSFEGVLWLTFTLVEGCFLKSWYACNKRAISLASLPVTVRSRLRNNSSISRS
jgi:hypothetical protein